MVDDFRFIRSTPFGVLVVAPVDDHASPPLFPEERALAARYGDRRLRTFTVGRAVLRDALARAGGQAAPILRTGRGAPVLPPGFCGSLSHKDEVAAALVQHTDDDVTLGVDIELIDEQRRDVAAHVLTPAEQLVLAPLDPAARARAVLERFSVKEAFYKAIDPKLERYVGFHEVEAAVAPDGAVVFATRVLEGRAPVHIDARVEVRGRLIVSLVRVRWR